MFNKPSQHVAVGRVYSQTLVESLMRCNGQLLTGATRRIETIVRAAAAGHKLHLAIEQRRVHRAAILIYHLKAAQRQRELSADSTKLTDGSRSQSTALTTGIGSASPATHFIYSTKHCRSKN